MAETGVKRTRNRKLVTDDGAPKSFLLLMRKDVLVGVPAGEPRTEGGITNAELGYLLDTGSPTQNIPPRPWLRPGIEDAKEAIKSALKAAAKAAVVGNEEGVIAGLTKAGIAAENAVKRRINSNVPPPLAESTIAKRRRRGVTRTNTLVDTGEFRNSVRYVIVDAKDPSGKGKR